MADDTLQLARQILEFGPMMMRSISAELRQRDHVLVTSHFRLLWILEHHSASLSELAQHQLVSLPSMSNSITFLEERGWVTRVRSLEDRRRVVIEITPAGREVLAQVREHMESRVSEIISSLSQEERADVAHGLSILGDAFASQSQKWCGDTHK